MNRWVNVKTKLPPPCTNLYKLHLKNSDKGERRYIKNDISADCFVFIGGIIKLGRYFHSQKFWGVDGDFRPGEVTHWMRIDRVNNPSSTK